MTARVAVAMSGGVDSSVAAAILKRKGLDVVGLTMRLWGSSRPEKSKRCCGDRDLADARAVAGQLDIPFYVLDFQEEFQREVVRPFALAYLQGRTPSPCILCNREVKFGRLQSLAEQLGATFLATGHYARVDREGEGERVRLLRGIDSGKDQSYFLFNLDQRQLRSLMLPIGDRTKAEVRRLAEEWELPVAAKEESQDLCFVSEGGYRAVIDQVVPGAGGKCGEIVDSGGRVLGTHDGIERFTVGQRRGLGISTEEPMYVISLQPERNRVVVGLRRETRRSGLVAEGVNWISFSRPPDSIEVTAKIRSRHPGAAARVRGGEGDRVHVEFREPQTGIAPGQAVVFYDGEEVLGGGWIRSSC